jgi:GDPmannose 4,6-dehydratase
MGKVALITGVTGQDGSYLSEFLLDKGYTVHGMIRRSSSFNTERVEHLYRDPHEEGVKFRLHYGDLLDPMGMRRLLSETQPDEIYNLAAQSHVKTSFDQPIYTVETITMGVIGLLEAVRDYRDASGKDVRLYQASSSEMFGSSPPPQSEDTPFRPRSPYACAKVGAYYLVRNYREAYGLFASNGILFNHESPRRLETFVTRKITRAVTRIKHGLQDKLYLGNLDAWRDWGYAPDYVEAMWLMLQHDRADDFVVATGVSRTVSEWLDWACQMSGIERAKHVEHDPRYLRPTEVDHLDGNASKARHVLNWAPMVPAANLCAMMVDHDDKLARQEAQIGAMDRGEYLTTTAP